MALNKRVDNEAGVAITYWRITRWDVDVIARKAWFVLAGYTGKDARDADKAPVQEKPFTMDVAAEVSLDTINREMLYTYAMAQEDFEGAEKV